jgi:threonine aldolase
MDLGEIEAAIKQDDPHFARSRLLALENTIGGKVVPQKWIEDALALAKRRGLATHLDGARIFNVAAKAERPVSEVCRGFDSVSACLSKGLGAPAGSVLVGKREWINRAVRARKILGGGMRQAGVLAAAGLYALEHNVERLAEDHANAARLGSQLLEIPGLTVEAVQTNMVFVGIPAERVHALSSHLEAHGVKATVKTRTRLCTHLDVDAAGIDQAVAAFRTFFRG